MPMSISKKNKTGELLEKLSAESDLDLIKNKIRRLAKQIESGKRNFKTPLITSGVKKNISSINSLR